ncbi:STAS domain-containing protein [Alteromonas sp. PRIM-21]|uniref:STAS domain-containing protein n=1 Tax=Alteromonas sp. PRIM-21 TaxID=1454978 RepID=UPI0022B97E96|nr:STAS domain-containing protein [Alteromonas sp. PRIM-21]MCZ8529573.1 STAS domain-containing protein [Alteromonas sp. PRIM-21]
MSLFEVNDTGRIVVHGQLDRETLSKNFWESLSGNQRSMLVSNKKCQVDLGDVERADSAGLAWLINAVRDAKQNGVSMTLYKMPEKLQKLAKISDADSFLPVE